jgi:hypothetical protein
MAETIEKVKDAASSAVHPVETAKDLTAEAERGRSPRTPLIALTGVTLVVGVLFVLLVTVALVLYFAYGGK